MQAAIDVAKQLQQQIAGTSIDTPQLQAALTNQISALGTLIGQVRAVAAGVSLSVILGNINGTNVSVGIADLAKADRLLGGIVQALAATPGISSSASALHSLAANTSPGCLAQEAQTLSQSLFGSTTAPSQSIFDQLPANSAASVACKTPQAFSTTFKVVGGAGAVGVAIGTLVALVAGVEAGLVVALPAAALVYVTITASGGEILVGGVLGQTSASAAALVIDGVKKLDGLILASLKVLLPKIAGAILAGVLGARSLIEVFTEPSRTASGNLTWSIVGSFTINGSTDDFSLTAIIPSAGGSFTFGEGAATVTATVSGSSFILGGSGFGTGSDPSIGTCQGSASGAGVISQSSTSFNASGQIGGNTHCVFSDGTSGDFPITGSFSATASQ